MRRAGIVLGCCVLLAVGACNRPVPPAPAAPAALPRELDLETVNKRPNLLTLGRGASVASRTAEQTLENSAAHAIDGEWLTYWRSPPGGPEQTLIFSLAARSRIDRIGVIVPSAGNQVPPGVRFAASDDGETWRPVAELTPRPERDPQFAQASPFEASYIRLETIGTAYYYAALGSVIANGTELEAPHAPAIDGCWHINGLPARFSQRGSSVAGVIGNDPPMYVMGGADDRVVRLQWLRGAMWGPALVTLDRRRHALSGVKWHETVRDEYSGDGWFGTPADCNAVTFNEPAIAAAMLQRAGKWIAYGDSALDTVAALIQNQPGRRFAIVTRDAARQNAVREALRIRKTDLSRVTFTITPSSAVNEPQRVIADGVDLHLR